MDSMQQYLNHSSIHVWELYSARLDFDLTQTIEEGKDAEYLKDLVAAVAALPPGRFKEHLADRIWEEMQQAKQRDDYHYVEPSKLEQIQNCRPARVALPKPSLNENELYDKILGAWTGRIYGCLLGKPIEGFRSPAIEKLAKSQDNYPVKNYFKYDPKTLRELGIENRDNFPWSDKITDCLPPDDDTNYTVMSAVKIVGRYGRDFTPQNVMDTWLECQGKDAYCTAERVAFINAVAGLKPPFTATYKNPYREWIGAMIRADYYGYINPGNPALAAEMAWRDASISHIKNGIYGAMFVAAMLAAAVLTDDILTVIQAGLAQIPKNCRLAEQINALLDKYRSGASQKDAFDWIKSSYNEYLGHHWCHVISNALVVVASLLYGNKKYGDTICIAVQYGFDTDCNAATAGSIIGMMLGTKGIEEKWSNGLPKTLATSIFGCPRVTIDELADITMKAITNSAPGQTFQNATIMI